MSQLTLNEIKSLGISAGLAVLNIGLIWAFLYTPLATVNQIVFSTLILGMLFYGVFLTAGNWLGKKGVRNGNKGQALLGIGLLQLAYGMFGAGVLNLLGSTNSTLIITVLGITATITVFITLLSGVLVYWTDRNFSSFQKYSMYSFFGALGAGLIGSFSGIFGIVAFTLVFFCFLFDLIYEIWNMKKRSGNVVLNGLGIYVAFMGVFVEILRLVVEAYLRR